jgi:hypothetical protein
MAECVGHNDARERVPSVHASRLLRTNLRRVRHSRWRSVLPDWCGYGLRSGSMFLETLNFWLSSPSNSLLGTAIHPDLRDRQLCHGTARGQNHQVSTLHTHATTIQCLSPRSPFPFSHNCGAPPSPVRTAFISTATYPFSSARTAISDRTLLSTLMDQGQFLLEAYLPQFVSDNLSPFF